MNMQNQTKLVQGFETFVQQLNEFGLSDNPTIKVVEAAFNRGYAIGNTYTKDSIPPNEEEQTIIAYESKNDFHLSGWAFRNKVIEHILKDVKRPLSPSELMEEAAKRYDIRWHKTSVCSYIQTAITHGFPIAHVLVGESKRGKYIHKDYALKWFNEFNHKGAEA